jgi:hypothetical protein
VLGELLAGESLCRLLRPTAACNSRGSKASGVCPLSARHTMNLERMSVKSDGLFCVQYYLVSP